MLSRLTPEKRQALATEADRLIARRRLEAYRPYPKQEAFHVAGSAYRERLLLGGNRVGKTECGAAEVAMHLTGRYPTGWTGRRFIEPVRWWAAGETGLSTRDVVQDKLVGPYAARELWGTGLIPGDALVDTSTARGVPDAIDTVQVKHSSGGISHLAFKTYEQGRAKWQGTKLHGVWFDEEPPQDIYTEGVTRTHDNNGIAMTTATPLKGMSEVVRLFYPEPAEDHRWMIQLYLDEAQHFSDEARATIIAGYPAHEREARAKGVPLLGSGRIFPLPDEALIVDPFQPPDHWPVVAGIDFGYDHPTAGVKLVWDRDVDTVYVTHEYRQRQGSPILHAAALKAWGDIPWAWPHDGLNDTAAGENLAAQYKAQGLNMMAERATHPDGSNSVEAGLMMMFDRMQTNRLKVFSTCVGWFAEFRDYHRKDGKVVKEFDDLMSATRYAMMMLREARLPHRRKVGRARAAYSMFGD